MTLPLTDTLVVLLSLLAGSVIFCALCAIEAFVLLRRARSLLTLGRQILGAAERLLAAVPGKSAARDRPPEQRARPRPPDEDIPRRQPPPVDVDNQLARFKYGEGHTRPDPITRRDVPRA